MKRKKWWTPHRVHNGFFAFLVLCTVFIFFFGWLQFAHADADFGDSLRYQGGNGNMTNEEIADLVWANSDDTTLWLSENIFIYEGNGWSDTVTILHNTKSYVNDSALLANGYMKVDGGWMAYFGNPDRPRIIKSPVIHFLQDSQLAGDANSDGLVNIGDVVWLLRFIFPQQ